MQIDADYELPNEEENERHDIQIEEIGCIYASFNFKNLVLITTFTFEKLGELYDVEMILRNIEGRRTIAASSFFPDRSRLATRRSYSLEKAKEYLKRVHIMEKRYIFTSSHLKIVQMMHIS